MSLSTRELFLRYMALPADPGDALEISHAEGIWLYTPDGKKYIDLVSGVSVSNLGHGHPGVIKAVQKQAAKYMHLMVYGKYIQTPQVELARLLAEHLPENLQQVFFVNSGSEAVEGALKLTKRFTGRTGLVAFKDSYHGSTQGALSVLGNEEMKYAYRPLLPDITHIRFGNYKDLQWITEKTAGVIVEPVQAEAGIIIPEKEFMQALRKRCTETGALLIFDEVQMGFGRTGKLFAFEHFEVVPDILCLAKAMGAGMPIGAFISSKEIMNTLTHHPALGHITTFGGHPVSAAAAIAGLEVLLDEKLPEKADEKGKLFVKLLSGHPMVKEIRQTGLMLGVEMEKPEQVTKLLKIFLEEGIVVDRFLFNDKSFRIAPPLTITEEEIHLAAKKILACLDKVSL
ncbi:MAG: aspartate aminotransferase family protein [Chlorobi bacterium]|nr:aspartate aminotransferase family protein [Chlorobiota bacterium]